LHTPPLAQQNILHGSGYKKINEKHIITLYRINRVRISDFHYLYNETSMETRSKEEKSAQFAYGISLTSNFIENSR
jgi:hypothetical protein